MRILLIILLLTFVTFFGCRTSVEPPPGPQVSLYERKLQDIVIKQEELFDAGVAGAVNEDTFVRRAANIASDYDQLIAQNPDQLLAYISYGKFLRRVGRREDAHLMFSRANEIDPSVAVVKQQIGNYLAEEGQYGAALVFYMAAIDLEPNQAAYHYSLGELYSYFGNSFVKDGTFTKEAVDNQMLAAFQKAAELQPNSIDFAMRYGEAFYDLFEPRWQDALQAWNELAARELSDIEADAVRLHKARVLIELERYKEAQQLLEGAVVEPLEATREDLLERLPHG